MGMRRILVTASATLDFNSPVDVFKSESMLCNKERIPLPRASLFCLGVVINFLIQRAIIFDFEIWELGNFEISLIPSPSLNSTLRVAQASIQFWFFELRQFPNFPILLPEY